MKRFNTITPLLMAAFIILPIVLILMIHHVTLNETLSKMDSGALGDESAVIYISSDASTPAQLYQTVKAFGSNIAVYADQKLDDGVTIRSIFFTKPYVNLPMQQGRFFKPDDFQEGYYTAVIGKKLLDRTYTIGNDCYINLEDTPFLVLGVIGYENATVWDQTVFINGYVQAAFISTPLYTLDFFSGNSSAYIDELLSIYQDQYGIEVKLLSAGTSFFSAFLPKLLYARWFIALLLCAATSIILLTVAWIRHKKIEFCVKRLVGARKRTLMFELLVQYTAMLLISYGVSFLYCTMFYPAYIRSLSAGFSAFIIFFIIFILSTSAYLLKTPIREGLN